MRVFVTGGSGFVGGHVIEGLVAAGHDVSAMARSQTSADICRAFGARPIESALGAVEPAHLEGCDAVVHCAAFVEEWGTRAQFWTANVDGTTQLLSAALHARAQRFIHIGTEAAVFDGHDLINIDETAPYPTKQKFLYSESKAEAERRVLAASSERFVSLSIRPRLVWGPRDKSVLPAVLQAVEDGGFMWLDGGQHMTSTTHIANLVHAVMLALEHGRGGEAYFVADAGQRSIREFLTALAQTEGVELPARSLPGGVARAAAATAESAWRFFGIKKKPPVTRFAAALMSATVTVSTEKAERELGYAPVIDVDTGLAALRAGGALMDISSSDS